MPQSERIIFNGHELSSQVPGAHVIEITIGNIGIEHNSQARVASFGSIFASKRDSVRPISIQVELPFDQEAAIINYNLLRAWAESDQPAPLHFPDRTNGYLNCIVSGISNMSVKTWYEPITISFVAYDPYFYGVTQRTQCGEFFRVAGDAPADFIITMQNDAAISNPAWLIDDVQHISFTGSVGAGLLTIDSSKGLAMLGDQQIMSLLNYETRFTPLAPGSHSITGSGGEISWIERWR